MNKVDYNKLINDIIEDIKPYHFLFTHGNKTILLSSGDNLNETKKKAIDKIKSKLESFHNKYIVKFKLRKINKKIYDRSKKEDVLTTIGGPIIINTEVYRVTSKGKLKMDEMEKRNFNIFITDNYLQKNKCKVSIKHLKKVAQGVIKRKFTDNILEINKIDKII